jgi:heme/copper-type cytochrome/quinol oxidase subunit 2
MASQLDYLNGAPVVRAVIERCPRVILMDAGSCVSLIQPGVNASQIRRTIVTPYGVTGDELRVERDQQLSFTINGEEFVHAFCVCKIATEADAILGTDFIRKADACLNFEGSLFEDSSKNRPRP